MHLQATISSVFETILARRSVRSYREGAPDRKTINTLLEAAVRAPTAMHAQPWAFVIVQDRQLLQRLSTRARSLADDEMRHRGLAPTDPHFEQLPSADASLFYDAGTLIVICAKPLGPFVGADCWLAAENLMLAARAIGLGSCVIGSAVPALNLPEVKSELGIPQEYSAIAPIIVGYSRGETPIRSRREPLVLAWLPAAGSRGQPAAPASATASFGYGVGSAVGPAYAAPTGTTLRAPLRR